MSSFTARISKCGRKFFINVPKAKMLDGSFEHGQEVLVVNVVRKKSGVNNTGGL